MARQVARKFTPYAKEGWKWEQQSLGRGKGVFRTNILYYYTNPVLEFKRFKDEACFAPQGSYIVRGFFFMNQESIADKWRATGYAGDWNAQDMQVIMPGFLSKQLELNAEDLPPQAQQLKLILDKYSADVKSKTSLRNITKVNG